MWCAALVNCWASIRFYVPNEGRFVAFVPQRDADRALAILRSQTVSAGAVQAGTIYEHSSGIVTLRSRIGAIAYSICCPVNSFPEFAEFYTSLHAFTKTSLMERCDYPALLV